MTFEIPHFLKVDASLEEIAVIVSALDTHLAAVLAYFNALAPWVKIPSAATIVSLCTYVYYRRRKSKKTFVHFPPDL